MIPFNDIRIFAAEFFYAWEHGEDFDWLRKEWHKFEPHLSDRTEAEDFILALAYIYSAFCYESFFLKSREGVLTVQECVDEYESKHAEFIKRIENKLDFTLDLLLKVYKRPDEVLREFVTIAIAFELPNPAGYEYIENLFKDIYKEPDIDAIMF